VKGEASPRVYANVWQAIDEIRGKPPSDNEIRIGLAGLPVDLPHIRASLFAPCGNVAIAAAEIAKLADRCKTHPRLKSDPVFCAVAVYRGSWERPDTEFAQAVQASVTKGDAPNFDMPDDTEPTSPDISSEMLPRENETSRGSAIAHDEREGGWSSALFPAKPKQSDSTSTDTQSGNASSHDQHSSGQSELHPSTSNPLTSRLFVPRSLPARD
jgi:hypothetical protein